MTPELGLAALWLATSFAGLQAACGFVPRLADRAAPAAWAQALLMTFATAALMLAFYTIDLSVEAVALVADATLPLRPRLMAVWATPSGAMLVAAMLLALANGGVAFLGASPAALARLGGIGLLADAAVLAAAPFARAEPYPTAGNGLAAALQQPWLALTLPLLAASVAALVIGLALGLHRRWLWAAVALGASAAIVEGRGRWLAYGDGRSPMLIAVAIAATIALVAAVVASRRTSIGPIVAVAGACLMVAGIAGPASRIRVVVPGTSITPAAGPGWSAIVAPVTIDGMVLAPEWRTYAPRGDVLSRAAAASGWRDTLAARLTDVPRNGRVDVAITRAPRLPLFWLGGLVLVAGAMVGVVRR